MREATWASGRHIGAPAATVLKAPSQPYAGLASRHPWFVSCPAHTHPRTTHPPSQSNRASMVARQREREGTVAPTFGFSFDAGASHTCEPRLCL